MDSFNDPRFVIAYTIVLGFAAAYVWNPSETMNGALIAAFAGAWGYYLGSSSITHQSRVQVDKALDLADRVAPPKEDPDIELKPGETKTVGAEPVKNPAGEEL